jgi:hypothetical protein
MAHSVKVELTPVVEAVYIDGIETVDLVLVVVKWVLMCNGFGVPESVV